MPVEKASYQEAAIAALTAAEAGETPPAAPEEPAAEAPEAPPAAEEPASEGEEPESDEKPAEQAEKPEEKKPAKAEKTWEEIAREKAKLREERQASAAEKARLTRAEALLQAAESGDALGLLAAAKIPWSKAAKQVLEGGKAEEPAPEADEKPASKLEREVAELKAELQAAKYEKAKTKLMDKIKETGQGFKFVSGLEAENEVFDFMDAYYRKTGEQLGDSLEESIQIACEAVDRDLAKKGDRWKKVLISGGSENKGEGKPAVPSTASKQVRTLTNDTGSGPRSVNPVKTQSGPKSDSDYRNDALKAFLAADTDE